MPVTPRPLDGSDSTAARALASAALADAPYAEPLLASLDAAIRSGSEEYRALVAHDGDRLAGVIVFGAIAGARGAGRLYLLAVDASARGRGLGPALVHAAFADLGAHGARFVVIELPDEPRLASALRLAQRTGFFEEARVGDYVRDGVGLLVLRRNLGDYGRRLLPERTVHWRPPGLLHTGNNRQPTGMVVFIQVALYQ